MDEQFKRHGAFSWCELMTADATPDSHLHALRTYAGRYSAVFSRIARPSVTRISLGFSSFDPKSIHGEDRNLIVLLLCATGCVGHRA